MFYIHILEENLHRPPKGELTFENPLENFLAFFCLPLCRSGDTSCILYLS